MLSELAEHHRGPPLHRESMGNVPAAVGVHDITGLDAAASIHVADSLTLSTTHE